MYLLGPVVNEERKLGARRVAWQQQLAEAGRSAVWFQYGCIVFDKGCFRSLKAVLKCCMGFLGFVLFCVLQGSFVSERFVGVLKRLQGLHPRMNVAKSL